MLRPCPQAWRPDRRAASTEEPSLHPAPGNRHVRLQPCLLSAGFHKRNPGVQAPAGPSAWRGPATAPWAHPKRKPGEQRPPRPWSSSCGLSKPRGGSLLITPFGASEAKKGVEQNLFSKQAELCRERERAEQRESPAPLTSVTLTGRLPGPPGPTHTRTGAAWRGVWTSASGTCAPKRLCRDGQRGVSPARSPCLVLF